MNGYNLSRKWWDFAFDNPEKVKPIHAALYFFSIEHCNRLGWKRKFGLPSEMVKDAIGVKSWRAYIRAFNELEEWGFFEVLERSVNQYSANIISLKGFQKEGNISALDTAIIKHSGKDDIEPENKPQEKPAPKTPKKTPKKAPIKRFIIPTVDLVKAYCLERKNSINAEQFIDHYTARGWMIGKNKMKDWKAAVRTWEKNDFGNAPITPQNSLNNSSKNSPIQQKIPSDSEYEKNPFN